jgi:hypothetical protein
MEQNERDEQDQLIYLEIVSNPALAERLRKEVGSLRETIRSGGEQVEVGEPPPGGLRALDPVTVGILIAVAKAAAGAIAGKISVDLYDWIKKEVATLQEQDRPAEVTAKIGGSDIPVPISNSPSRPSDALKAVENGIRSAAAG